MSQLLPEIKSVFDEISGKIVSQKPERDKEWVLFMDLVDKIDTKARILEEKLLKEVPKIFREILKDAFSRKKNHDRTLAGYIGEMLAGGEPDRHFKVLFSLDVLDFSVLSMDDILDRAERRAIKSSFHKKWGLQKASVVIMLLKGLSNILVLQSSLSETVKNRIISELEDTHLKIYEGQFLDNEYEDKSIEDIEMDDYLKMIQLTTGWQIAKAFKIGGILAGADGEISQDLEKLGLIIGTLGQMRDDIIDYLPEEKTWKTPFLDFINGKKRFPLVFIWKYLSNEQKERIKFFQSKHELKEEEKIEIIDILFGKDNLIKMKQFMSKMKKEADEILVYANFNKEAISVTRAFLTLMSVDIR